MAKFWVPYIQSPVEQRDLEFQYPSNSKEGRYFNTFIKQHACLLNFHWQTLNSPQENPHSTCTSFKDQWRGTVDDTFQFENWSPLSKQLWPLFVYYVGCCGIFLWEEPFLVCLPILYWSSCKIASHHLNRLWWWDNSQPTTLTLVYFNIPSTYVCQPSPKMVYSPLLILLLKKVTGLLLRWKDSVSVYFYYGEIYLLNVVFGGHQKC